MKITRTLRCILTALAVMAGTGAASAQSGNNLLLPFPAESRAEEIPVRPALTDAGSGREKSASALSKEETRRALELADTFLRRQQAEVSHSVPRRGLAPIRVPARNATAPQALIAKTPMLPAPAALAPPVMEGAALTDLPLDPHAGPSSELLPLPAEAGAPDISLLPDAAALLPPGQPTQTEGDSPPGPEDSLPNADPLAVPGEELAPMPAWGHIETQDRRGPVFRIAGADAVKLARTRGFKFTPAGGIGARDGNRTAASQFPNVFTSEVHGTRMAQLRPLSSWKMEETANTFFMFCDASYNAVRLNPGWRIRGIRLDGPNWRWVVCPVSGANTASFSVRIYSYKNQEAASAVQLAGMTLEGPEGATDWQDAFPDLKAGVKGPASSPAPLRDTPADSAPLAAAGEPPLPQ